MPELPEVETVARILDPLLRGRVIESFELRWPRTLEHPSPDEFRCRIIGRTIIEVRRRAKLVVMQLDDGGAITVHLRMTGELLFRPAAATPRTPEREPYLRAIFGFADCSELLFYDTRKFGKIAYRGEDELAELDDRLGREPLDPSFTPDVLRDILLKRARRIKPLLLDQTVIAGLGNIYVDEALFRAGIHPLQISRTISAERVEALHTAIIDLLTTAIQNQGTTLRDYRSGLGEPGTNQTRLRVYGLKPGTPCPECARPLQRLTVGQRGTIYCPGCQPFSTVIHTPSR